MRTKRIFRHNYDHLVAQFSQSDRMVYDVYFNDAVMALKRNLDKAEKTTLSEGGIVYYSGRKILVYFDEQVGVASFLWREMQSKFPEHIFRKYFPSIETYHKKGDGIKLKNRFVFRVVAYQLGYDFGKREISGLNKNTEAYIKNVMYDDKKRQSELLQKNN